LSCLETTGKTGDVIVNSFGEFKKFATVGKFQVFVVGEVEFEFEERGEFEELFAQLGEFGGEMASELTHGHLVGSLVGGGDEVGYGLGLREIHLAVEVGALGIFAGGGHAAAVGDQ